MQVEAALGRAGLWFGVLLISLVFAATARDSGFAAHATIIAIVSFVLMWISVARFDPMGKARGFFQMPDGPSRYDDDPIRWGVLATMFEIVGLLAGVFIASQLAFRSSTSNHIQLRPGKTASRRQWSSLSVAIFSSRRFYVVQRRAQLASVAGPFVFWGYQLFIVLAASGYLFGVTQSREYAGLNGMWTCG